jgi:hypothetical protein
MTDYYAPCSYEFAFETDSEYIICTCCEYVDKPCSVEQTEQKAKDIMDNYKNWELRTLKKLLYKRKQPEPYKGMQPHAKTSFYTMWNITP